MDNRSNHSKYIITIIGLIIYAIAVIASLSPMTVDDTVLAQTIPLEQAAVYLPVIVYDPLPTATPTNTPTTTPVIYSGVWSGSTSQKNNLTLQVSEDGSEVLNVVFDYTYGHDLCQATITIKLLTPVPIVNRQFTAKNKRLSASFTGTFTAPNQANGTYVLTKYFDQTPCGGTSGSGSWSAKP